MGVGTTAVAAKTLNRNFIGFETNPKYIEIAEVDVTSINKSYLNWLIESTN